MYVLIVLGFSQQQMNLQIVHKYASRQSRYGVGI